MDKIILAIVKAYQIVIVFISLYILGLLHSSSREKENMVFSHLDLVIKYHVFKLLLRSLVG